MLLSVPAVSEPSSSLHCADILTACAQRAGEIQAMNDELVAQVAAIEEKDRQKDVFLATLAHELRNHLAPLSNAAEILARAGDGPGNAPARRRAVGVISRQVVLLARLIEDVLDLSRVTYGKLTLRRERVSLLEIVESALETAGPLLLERGHVLTVALPDSPVYLCVDPVRIVQVLTNLLENAAKCTEPGGRIRVEAVRDEGVLAISVSDSGIGIRPDELGFVFELFGQARHAQEPRAPAPVNGGLGIGLALSKSLAEMHGGSLSAASEGEGQGSVFTLCLACPEVVPTE